MLPFKSSKKNINQKKKNIKKKMNIKEEINEPEDKVQIRAMTMLTD